MVGYRQKGDTLYELKEREILKRRAEVGMVFQSFNLFPHLTALENIIEAPIAVRGISKEQAQTEARDLLARVGLAEKAGAYPRQLSGGQQQRVAIARTLAARPALVLADEPTGNLDETTSEVVLDLMISLSRSAGSALLLVTHSSRMARKLDRQVVLRGGKIVA